MQLIIEGRPGLKTVQDAYEVLDNLPRSGELLPNGWRLPEFDESWHFFQAYLHEKKVCLEVWEETRAAAAVLCERSLTDEELRRLRGILEE